MKILLALIALLCATQRSRAQLFSEIPKDEAAIKLVDVLDTFESEVDTMMAFLQQFQNAGTSTEQSEACRSIAEHPASKEVSLLAQDLNMTVSYDIGADATFLFMGAEFAVSLFWGEDGQFACSQNVGLGATIGLQGVGVSQGISVSNWEAVGASWAKPPLCLSVGYSVIFGVAGTVAFDPSEMSKPVSVLVEEITNSIQNLSVLADPRGAFLEILFSLVSQNNGFLNVGVESNFGVDLLDFLTFKANSFIPDFQLVACTERLVYCEGEGCDEKMFVASKGEECAVQTDCKTELYCNRGRCYDGSNGDRCSFHSDCISNICHPGSKTCSSGAEGSQCGLSLHCMEGLYCNSGQCYDGSNGDRCSIHSDCNSNICHPGSKTCSRGAEGSQCGLSLHCTEGLYCNSGQCYDGSNGDRCSFHSDCNSNICHPGSKTCSSGAEGSLCGLALHCMEGLYCKGKCYDGSSGDPCTWNGQCKSGKCKVIGGKKCT